MDRLLRMRMMSKANGLSQRTSQGKKLVANIDCGVELGFIRGVLSPRPQQLLHDGAVWFATWPSARWRRLNTGIEAENRFRSSKVKAHRFSDSEGLRCVYFGDCGHIEVISIRSSFPLFAISAFTK